MEISDDHDITVIYQIRSVHRRARRFAGGCVKIRAFWGPGVLFAGLFAVSGSAQAANEIGTFDERFLLRAGLMYSNQDTQLRLDGDNLLGVSVDLEDFFNLDEALDSVVQIMGRWRFAERHRIGLEYYSFDRGAKSVLQQDWVGDNIEASAGATADTLLNIGIWDLSYTYSFLRESNYELSGTIGLFFMDVDIVVDLQGELEVGGVPVSSGRAAADARVAAPLPLIGLDYDYALTPRWLVGASFKYFTLRTGKIDGSIVRVSADTRYYLWNHVEIGAGLTVFDLDINADVGDFKGTVDWSFWGPQVFLGARF